MKECRKCLCLVLSAAMVMQAAGCTKRGAFVRGWTQYDEDKVEYTERKVVVTEKPEHSDPTMKLAIEETPYHRTYQYDEYKKYNRKFSKGYIAITLGSAAVTFFCFKSGADEETKEERNIANGAGILWAFDTLVFLVITIATSDLTQSGTLTRKKLVGPTEGKSSFIEKANIPLTLQVLDGDGVLSKFSDSAGMFTINVTDDLELSEVPLSSYPIDLLVKEDSRRARDRLIDTLQLDPSWWLYPFAVVDRDDTRIFSEASPSSEEIRVARLGEYLPLSSHRVTGLFYRLKDDAGWVRASETTPVFFDPESPTRPTAPPRLALTVEFDEPSGNRMLDAEESGYAVVSIANGGAGPAHRVVLHVEEASPCRDLSVGPSQTIGRLDPGTSATVKVPLTAGESVETGVVKLTFQATEFNGFDSPPVTVSFSTREFLSPQLIVSDIGINDHSPANGKIEPGEIVDVVVRILNTGAGKAETARAGIEMNDPQLFPQKPLSFDLGTMLPGDYRDVTFRFFTNDRYDQPMVPFSVILSEARGKYGRTESIVLAFNRPERRAIDITIPGIGTTPEPPVPEPLTVDVDSDIPRTGAHNPKAIAVVIGNRNYESRDIPAVDFAIRDAEVVKDYLINTLGYSEANVILKTDATLADLNTVFGTKEHPRGVLHNLVSPDGTSDIFIYYSGHGAPEVTTKTRFILPVDCNPLNLSLSAHNLDQLFANVSGIPYRTVTIVIDACFSGGSERGAVIPLASPPQIMLEGFPGRSLRNATVITSASGSEISSWYPQRKHGLFTYFFLKAIGGAADANADGEITAREIFDYVSDIHSGVPYHARRLSTDRNQTPYMRSTDPGRVIVKLK